MISCALSPNTESDDVLLALRVLLAPWVWKRGTAIAKVEKQFGGVSFNSGRTALLAILRAFDIGRGDEVICQAFTCVAVPNSVRWAGATPVYVDINASYTIDPKDFEKKITRATRAVVVQHTFGIRADMDAILSIARKNHVIVIEDFAHSMTIPMRGDAAFYSFGRDKVLSSVFGGMAVIHSKFKNQNSKLKVYHKKLPEPRMFWIFQQLLHPVAFAIILSYYPLGKFLLVVLQKIRLLSFPVYPEEKLGKQPGGFPAKYPNALALLLLQQLKKIDRYTNQRKEASKIYGDERPYLRFPIRVDNPKDTFLQFKKHGILLGNWYHNVIDPEPFGYIFGTCPRAEDAARHCINLPTRISENDAKRVMAEL